MFRQPFGLAGAFLLAASVSCASSQPPPHRIVTPIDEAQVVTLEGNVHPQARAEFDQGPVSPDLQLNRMLLVLAPSPAQQANLDALVQAQQDPASPLYHHWLTPAEFGARFGADDQDLAQIAAWLVSCGFTIDPISTSRRLIFFSGSASQVYDTFHTEMHRYRVHDATHIANNQDPQIPAALVGTVRGIVSLHDFRRAPEMHARIVAGAQPDYSAGSTHYLFPADFATIYNLNPLYNSAITGAGSSIAVVGRSNIEMSDVAAFRSIADLPGNTPAVILDGADPGLVAADQDESTLDVEWSGAVAPAASLNLVVAASTSTTDGIDLAAAYAVNRAVAPVLSVSYGSCEQAMGVAELAFYNDLWEQAASEGISVFVASGDAGVSGCSAAADEVGSGPAVNGLCSSPYATCVGGTEFNEGADTGQLWSPSNSSGYGSALGYIPEVVWNESALQGGTGLWASGGGASAVYAQPAWQAGISGTSAANDMRAVPDVALASADHDGYFVVENGAHWIVSGTSVAAPAFAGLMALAIDKQRGATQGNANPRLYSLAIEAQNPFHPTPSGNNTVPGVSGFAASGATYNMATGLGSVDGTLLVNRWDAESTTVLAVPRASGCPRFNILPSRCRPPLQTPIPAYPIARSR